MVPESVKCLEGHSNNTSMFASEATSCQVPSPVVSTLLGWVLRSGWCVLHWLIIIDFVIILVKSNHLEWILIVLGSLLTCCSILLLISCLAQWQCEVYGQLLNLQQAICVQEQTTAVSVRRRKQRNGGLCDAFTDISAVWWGFRVQYNQHLGCMFPKLMSGQSAHFS